MPDLAAALPQVSADSRTVTVDLRTDVRFHDGEPFTADDVVFTWQALTNPALGVAGVQRLRPGRPGHLRDRYRRRHRSYARPRTRSCSGCSARTPPYLHLGVGNHTVVVPKAVTGIAVQPQGGARPFAPRCTEALDACRDALPPLQPIEDGKVRCVRHADR